MHSLELTTLAAFLHKIEPHHKARRSTRPGTKHKLLLCNAIPHLGLLRIKMPLPQRTATVFFEIKMRCDRTCLRRTEESHLQLHSRLRGEIISNLIMWKVHRAADDDDEAGNNLLMLHRFLFMWTDLQRSSSFAPPRGGTAATDYTATATAADPDCANKHIGGRSAIRTEDQPNERHRQ